MFELAEKASLALTTRRCIVEIPVVPFQTSF